MNASWQLLLIFLAALIGGPIGIVAGHEMLRLYDRWTRPPYQAFEIGKYLNEQMDLIDRKFPHNRG